MEKPSLAVPTLRAFFRMKFYELMVAEKGFDNLSAFLDLQHGECEKSLKSDLPEMFYAMIRDLVQKQRERYEEIFGEAMAQTYKLAQLFFGDEKAGKFTKAAIFGAKDDYDILEKKLLKLGDYTLRDIMLEFGLSLRDNASSKGTDRRRLKSSEAATANFKKHPDWFHGLQDGVQRACSPAGRIHQAEIAQKQIANDPTKVSRMVCGSLSTDAIAARRAGCAMSWAGERRARQSPISQGIAAGQKRDPKGRFVKE
ncbi:MAG: hypothetical protein V2A63_03290 [Patescibacteria group bacterium]